MQYTSKFHLALPDPEDPYNIGTENSNMEILDAGAVAAAGNISTVCVTDAQGYAALHPPDAQTLYIVPDGGSFSMFYGEIPMRSAGGSPVGTFTPALTGTTGLTGIIETQETEES